ncbi:hypothetical protein EX30DRAFT_349477 [Ascodesmis nigricans]|uniref:Uncharacterized protein n=1 Tax=Ascodesmis nigricans TaxID=341454 RepID=A0A4S2MUW1_9PEZI|nr:hypothetical protein EX30DRAFT_349477 [Ascodesmis nigricans]
MALISPIHHNPRQLQHKRYDIEISTHQRHPTGQSLVSQKKMAYAYPMDSYKTQFHVSEHQHQEKLPHQLQLQSQLELQPPPPYSQKHELPDPIPSHPRSQTHSHTNNVNTISHRRKTSKHRGPYLTGWHDNLDKLDHDYSTGITIPNLNISVNLIMLSTTNPALTPAYLNPELHLLPLHSLQPQTSPEHHTGHHRILTVPILMLWIRLVIEWVQWGIKKIWGVVGIDGEQIRGMVWYAVVAKIVEVGFLGLEAGGKWGWGKWGWGWGL